MNADGSQQRRLTNNPAEDIVSSWSPDGSRIAFSSNRDGHPEIYLMNPDGSKQVRVTTGSVENMYPVWSPDGSKMAYASGSSSKMDICVMPAPGPDASLNTDGIQVQRLTDGTDLNFSPAWRPEAPKLTAITRCLHLAPGLEIGCMLAALP
jgi:TolB protein